jgi:hypothetical protein
MSVDLTPQGSEKVWRWVVRYRSGTEWTTILLPGTQLTHMFAGGRTSPGPDEVAVSAVDRTGNESAVVIADTAPTVVPRPTPKPKPKATRPPKKAGRKKKG